MDETSAIGDVLADIAPSGFPRLVIGITHPQTCLVLRGRLRALRKAGFDVTLVSSPGSLLDALGRLDDIQTVGLPIEREIALLSDLISLIRLWALLRRMRPDAVEFSTPKAGLLGMLAAWIARVPHRVYLLRGLKLETSSGSERFVLWAAEWIACACAETVLCTSRSVYEKTLALRIAGPGKLRVLGDGSSAGVDIDRFRPGTREVRKQLSIPDDAQLIGFVGRMTRDKGLPELVAAFDAILREMPNAWLLLVGWFDEAEDALDPGLRQRIVAHPHIVHTGFVDDAAPYYRAMDVLILPTMREGFPNVVLEGSASGLPVITTLVTGSRDAVVPEVTGLLVPAACPDALVDAALRLLRDDELRRRMGAAGRKWVTEHFSRDLVLRMNVEFYRQLIGSTDAYKPARTSARAPFAKTPWPAVRPEHREAAVMCGPQSGSRGGSFPE